MDCRLGFVEYDGFQFCFEHLGWRHYTDRSMWCRDAPLTALAAQHEATP